MLSESKKRTHFETMCVMGSQFSSSFIFKLCERKRIRLLGLLIRPVSPFREGIFFQTQYTFELQVILHICVKLSLSLKGYGTLWLSLQSA